MAKQQEPLPLEENLGRDVAQRQIESSAVTPESVPSLTELLKRTNRVRRVLTQTKKGQANLSAQDVGKVVSALQAIEIDRVVSELEKQRAALTAAHDETLSRRREDLERAAKAAGWTVRRLSRFDDVDCFRLEYKKDKVVIKLGSEVLLTVTEVDGSRLLSRLRTEKQQLEAVSFDRAEFFATIKAAIGLARVLDKDRDGKVLVRDLHPLVVLIRQTGNERFVKRPTQRLFAEYPMAQFAFDLARFGRDGWATERGERLSNQPPNMASISKGLTVTLPSLDGRKGEQICALYVQRARR